MAETETFVGASGELHDGTGFVLGWTKPGTDPAAAMLEAWNDGVVEGLGASVDSGAGDTYYLAPTAQGTDAMAYGRIRSLSEAKNTPLCAKLQDDQNYAAIDVVGTGSVGTRIEVSQSGVQDDGDVQFQGSDDLWIKVEVDAAGNIEGFSGGTGASPSWTSEGSHATTAFGAETNQGLVCPSNISATSGADNAKYYEITFDGISGGGGDTTAPTYDTAPAIDNVNSLDITADATATDETDATVNHYAVLVADGATAPTPAEVKAGESAGGGVPVDSGSDAGVANGAEASITLTGDTASTAYDVYWTVEDQSGNLTAVQKLDTTTGTVPDIAFSALKDQDGQLVPDATTINYQWWPDSGGAGTQDIDNLTATPESGSQATSGAGSLTLTGLTSGDGFLALQWTRAGDSKIHRHVGRYTVA